MLNAWTQPVGVSAPVRVLTVFHQYDGLNHSEPVSSSTPVATRSVKVAKGYGAVMTDALRVDEQLAIPLAEIELRASRSSGPGGQHANVTASRVEAVFDVRASRALDEAQRGRLLERLGPVVTAVAQESRGQARNRELALQRLGEKIAAGLVVPRSRRATKPSRAARQRRLEGKRQVAERKRARRRPAAEDD